MEKIDFKNLSKKQEDKLNELLKKMNESVLNSANNLSVPPEQISIYSSDKKMALKELKADAEKMTPEWIEHLRMWFESTENIMRIRLEGKALKKKSFWSRVRFW
jgi:hypothetical protein